MNKKKPSLRGLFFIVTFLCISLLPVALFDVGYKSHFVSKELVLVGLLDLLFLYILIAKAAVPQTTRTHVLIIFPIAVIGLCNLDSPHLLALCLLYALLFVFVAATIRTENLSLLIAWSAMIATLLSFYQHWASAYGVVPDWLGFRHHSNRMSGVTGQANLMSCLIITGLFAWMQTLWQKYGQQHWPWITQVPVVIFVWAFLLTGSRTGTLAAGSAVLVTFFVLFRSGRLNELKPFASRLIVSLCIAFVLYNLVTPVGNDVAGVRALDLGAAGVSADARFIFWGSAFSMFLDHPWTGVGLGGFRRLLGGYMTPVAERLQVPYDGILDTLWAHNDFLHVLSENGLLVGFPLIVLFASILWRLWPNQIQKQIFPFCALWSFMVFMLFGHPLNDYVLTFYLVLLIASAMPFSGTASSFQRLRIPLLMVLAVFIVWINFVIVAHAIEMHSLERYLVDVSRSHPLTVERLQTLREEYRYESLLVEPLLGWEFRYKHLNTLAQYAFVHKDAHLAEYLISEFEGFKSEHSSAKLTHQLSRLYYLVGEYAICKETADKAFLLKPDMYYYSNFGHICLVFDISRQKGLPVDQLLGDEVFHELKNNEFFRSNMLDANRIAL